ncbi:MAG TPA: transposase [Ktedonobacterales bacterium]|nr:transposase [Ktedonobacterales bacterium]
MHTLLWRGTGLPLPFWLSTAKAHDAPVARPLLECARCLLALRPRVIRLDAGYWGLKLIAWIHSTLGAVAVIPWNPKRQQRRDGLPPPWTADELVTRTSSERFFGRVLVFFRLQRPPICGWSALETRVALTDAAVWVVALAAWQEGRPKLIRSPRLVLASVYAHVWEGSAICNVLVLSLSRGHSSLGSRLRAFWPIRCNRCQRFPVYISGGLVSTVRTPPS